MTCPRPRAQQRLRDCLHGKPYVHVYEIHRAVRGRAHTGSPRSCQQALGALVTRYNRWPHSMDRVLPGFEPNTYRLIEG